MMTYKPSARLCDGTEGQQRLEEKDVDARDLQRELRSLSRLVNDDDGPLDVLRYIVSSGLVDVYCNCSTPHSSVYPRNRCVGRAFLLGTPDHQKLFALYDDSTASVWPGRALH